MTGRYSARLGFSQAPVGIINLPLLESTLAEELQLLGYRTSAFGKWMLGFKASFFKINLN